MAESAILSNTPLKATGDPNDRDWELYVEGWKVGSGTIKVNWTNSAGTKTQPNVDRIKVTVFDWSGPLNVPGHSIYTYTASGAAAGAHWLTPVGGETFKGFGGTTFIKWAAGPVVGAAVFEAHPDYVWGLDVNVVQISIADNATNAITIDGDAVFQNGSDIVSSPGIAFKADLTVARLEGPTRGAVGARGVKFIELGFIQNLHVLQYNAEFAGLNPVRRNISSMEGFSGIDMNIGPPRSTIPWYNRENQDQPNGTYAFYSQPADDLAQNGLKFLILPDCGCKSK